MFQSHKKEVTAQPKKGVSPFSNTCPCFDEYSIQKIADGILSLEYDIENIADDCKIRKNEIRIENKLYVKEMSKHLNNINYDENARDNIPLQDDFGKGIFPPQFRIGYGVEVARNGSGHNYCYDHDMVQKLKRKDALSCLNIINEGCMYLKEKMCPCFNMQDLVSTIDKKHNSKDENVVVHCDNTDEGVLGLFDKENMIKHDPMYGLDRSSQQSCMRGKKIRDVNEDQYDHCLKLFKSACDYAQNVNGNDDENNCQENEKFLFRGRKRNWCIWAKKKRTSFRCRKYTIAEKCPLTCFGSCDE